MPHPNCSKHGVRFPCATCALARGRQGVLAQGDLEALIATVDQQAAKIDQLEHALALCHKPTAAGAGATN